MLQSLAVIAAVALAASGTAFPPPPTAATLYINGKVWQGEGQPDAEALLVSNGRILAVGSRTYLAGLQGSESLRAQVVDLRGRRVIPALVDAHSHPESYAHPSWLANGTDWVERGEYGPTAEEGRALLAAKVAQLPVGTPAVLIVGINFYRTVPKDVRAFLDSISTAHPILVQDWGGHGQGCNSALLAEAGYVDGTPDSETGRLSRDASGRLTGWVQEMMELPVFHALSDRLSDSYVADALATYGDGWAQYGGSTVYDINAFIRPSRMPTIRAMVAQKTTVHFVPVDILTSSGPRPGPHDGRRVWKVFMDGAPSDCTMLRQASPPLAYTAPETCPYAFTSPWYGAPDVTGSFVTSVLRDARRLGAHVLFHALGDGGVENLLSAVESVGCSTSWAGVISLEHGDLATPGQLARLRACGVPLVQNPLHLVQVPSLTMARVDPATVADSELLASVLAAGVPLAFGTDAFIYPSSPWLEMQLAVTHPFNPSEAITREEFLTGYTSTAARVRGQGPLDRAVLAPGQPASFAVLSQDVLDESAVPVSALPATQSVLTVVRGQVAWDASTGIPTH